MHIPAITSRFSYPHLTNLKFTNSMSEPSLIQSFASEVITLGFQHPRKKEGRE